MAQVPGLQVLPKLETRGVGTPYSYEKTPDAGPGLERALSDIGETVAQGLKQVGQQYTEREQARIKAQHEADTVKVNDSLTAFDKEGTDELAGTTTPSPGAAADAAFDERDTSRGYLSTHGSEATGEGVAAFERLKRRRQALEDQLTNDDQRRLFREQSGRMLEGYYGRIEAHAAQQREQAAVDSLKAAEEEAARAVANDPTNSELARDRIARITGAQAQFSTSVQDAFGKQDRATQVLTEARLNSLLGKPDGWPEAEKVFKEMRPALGTRADEYEKRIEAAKFGSLVQVEAGRIADEVQRPDGRLDVPKAEEQLKAIDPKMQKAVRSAFFERATHAKAAADARDDEVVKGIWGVKNQVGWSRVPADMKRELNRIDPKLYDSFEDEAFRRWKMSQGSKADQRREQAAIDKAALADYRLSGDNAAARAPSDVEAFIARYPDLSNEGANNIRLAHQGDKGVVDKGLSVNEATFMARGKKAGAGIAKGKEAQRDYQEELSDAYANWRKNNEGKAMSEEDAAKQIGALTAKMIKKGLLWDSTEYGYERRHRRRVEEQKASVGAKVLPELDLSQPDASAAAKGTGVFKTDPQGRTWEKMSDGSARQVR